MKKIIHKSETRGLADHGWLKSRHTFSFAGYFNKEMMNFGLLRVLNDDIVKAGMGFGTHPHDNMEIVSIPLSGELAHKDSTGTKKVIKTGDVQIMSAGSGVTHSEFNNSDSDPVNFLQIWILPDKRDITPRYDQKSFKPEDRWNKILNVISPEISSNTLWINQDVFFSLAKLEKDKSLKYDMHTNGNGLYIFIIDGEVNIADENISMRDAIGLEDITGIELNAQQESDILLIEVPITLQNEQK